MSQTRQKNKNNQMTLQELQSEVMQLRRDNARLVESNKKAYEYIRDKVNQLLTVMGTKTLRSEELDNESMIDFDPIGIVSDAFQHVLENLRETNRNLHFAHEEIQAIFDSVGSALLVLSPLKKILACNQKTRDLLVDSNTEIYGHDCSKVICRGQTKKTRCVFEKVMSSGREQHIQDWTLDGHYFNVIGRPMFDENDEISHVVLSYTDVTARKNAEEALVYSLAETQEANSKIQGILKTVSDGLLITDADDRIVLINHHAETLLGFCLVEGEERPGLDVLRPDSLRKLLKKARKMGKFIKQDLIFPDELGTENIYQARITVIRSSTGDYRGCIAFLHDVTEQRELDRSKSEFVSTAAHELRTPLATIIGYTDLLLHQEEGVGGNLNEYLNLIQLKAERLAEIVSDLLDISRIESGEALKLELKPHRVDELCGEIVNGYQTLDVKHKIILDLPSEKDLKISVDRYAFGQILENLISNAVKYSPNGGTIRVQVYSEKGQCRLSVSDEGIGMSPAQVEQIFDKFYRADATNTAISGTGLGMTIVKHLVEAQKGTVHVESKLHHGTTVQLSFPLAETYSETLH